MVNRSGNRPSHEGAAAYFHQAIELCRKAGFQRITLRGDTDFSQTRFLDGWDEQGVSFIFGFKAVGKLDETAAELPESAWSPLSNWAYMVMASLAWTLKAWFALLLPENGHESRSTEHGTRTGQQ